MGRIFGMDGIRGAAAIELTCESALQLGKAAALVLSGMKKRPVRVLIGKDARVGSDVLESAFAAGVCAMGGDAVLLGVVPASALPLFVREEHAGGGVMISGGAAHPEISGIRLFGPDGCRLSGEQEDAVEALLLDTPQLLQPKRGQLLGRMESQSGSALRYVSCVANQIQTRFDGMRIALDCANGSASYTARRLFECLGAEVLVYSDRPDGRNINQNCAYVNAEGLMELTRERHCHAGFAFDGEAARVLAVDEAGELVDGEKLLALFTEQFAKRGMLGTNPVVYPTTSNLGLFHFAAEQGVMTASVRGADRCILDKIRENDSRFGGGSGGFLVFPDFVPAGDGQYAALKLMELMQQEELPLSALSGCMTRFPQVMMSVRIVPEQREMWKNDPVLTELMERREAELAGDGRIMVQEHDTEPLVRIRVEGKDFRQINRFAQDLATAFDQRVGAR